MQIYGEKNEGFDEECDIDGETWPFYDALANVEELSVEEDNRHEHAEDSTEHSDAKETSITEKVEATND